MQSEETQTVAFKAVLSGARTTVDGGWRVTLDVAQTDSQAIMELSKLRDMNLMVAVVHDAG